MVQRTIKTRFTKDEPEGLDEIIIGSYDNFIRHERRNLLVSSSITLVSYFGNAAPSGLNTPMIKFPNMTETMLFAVLVAICLYFLIAYSIYAYPIYRSSNKKWKDLTSKSMEITSNFHRFHLEKDVFLSNSRFVLWKFISFYLPILMGILAVVAGLLKIA